MNCPTCDTTALSLQRENSLLAPGLLYYCIACTIRLSRRVVEAAELANWNEVDAAFAEFDVAN